MKKERKWRKISKKKKVFFLIVLIAGVGLVSLGIYSLRGTRKKAIAREIPVQETQAKTGTISNTIVGTGNLEYEEGVSITIPSGVVVDEINVESSDRVSKGDVLAVVNQTSVLRAMEDVQEEIEDLDEEIEDSMDDTDSQSVKSKVDGRVKKIYVQKDQDVSDCMVEQGALMLLSIDGYLVVEIESDAKLAEGDTVTITRPDGTKKEGTIETAADGRITVLCSDRGVGIEENVTVEDSEGNILGSGVTGIHQMLAVTAATGTVTEICVSEDEKIYTGSTLLKVENDGQSLKYQEQMAKRQELTDNLQKLIALSKSGVITAESDGIIKSVNISADSDEAGTEEAQTSQKAVSVVGSTQISRKVVSVVGSVQTSESTADENIQMPEPIEEKGKTLMLHITDSGAADQDTLVIETPQTGATPQNMLCVEDGSYEGTISWKPNAQKFAAETSYQAYVTLTSGEGFMFENDSITQIKTGVLSGVTVTEDGKKCSFYITYPFTSAEKTKPQNGEGTENGSGTGTKDGNETGSENESGTGSENGSETGNENGNETRTKNGNETGSENESGTGSENGNGSGAGTGNAVSTGSRSDSVTTTGTSSQTTDSDSSVETTDSDNEVVAFTMSSSDTMVLSVNVDELDINSVTEDQQAEITLDAIEDETFTGTVTKVGNSASVSGGVAKYVVELTLPGDERMKEGMNASAVITIEERENVVTIPVNALSERGMKTFVYTQKDSDGNLSGEQEVTTGLSDGDMVEITEGLSEGDIVYYQKTGNVSNQGDSHGFGGMEEGSGNMGEMPGGGFKGGESGGMPGGGMPNEGGKPLGQQ